MTTASLFDAYSLAGPALHLPNRIVLAPMTRFRATKDGSPLPFVADFYAQRATAGLLISEGIWPSRRGQSEWRIPGLETTAHIDGWRRVTDAVHNAGGRIFAQLMHGGRQGHPLSRIAGDIPAGPSSVPVPGPVHIRDGGKADPPLPRTMTRADIRVAIEDHAAAARGAITAGFDGVELHGANSYLIHQFLADNTNLRDDRYGRNSTADRIRFAVECVTRVAEEIGAGRTALRLSPGNPQFGMHEADPLPVYRALLAELDTLGLGYLHLTDAERPGVRTGETPFPMLADLRPGWSGTLIANVGENGEATTRSVGEKILAEGLADLVSYGRAFLANPDLPARFALDAPLNTIEEDTLYTQGPEGYTTYPVLAEALVRD